MADRKKYLVTSALPYANGPIHLGHLAGAYLPADIFVRYCRLKKRDVIYMCGTDEHGVPITITAEKEGKTPQQVVDYYYQDIKETFRRVGMSFDNFSRTSRPIHHQTAQDFFLVLYKKGFMEKRTIQQFYCEKDRMFLADRYIEGTCPYCGEPGARGDQCEKCGKWLEPTQLVEPRCKICGSQPVIRETFHYFFKLNEFQSRLDAWIDSKAHWRENVVNFCKNWFREGLEPRAVTRDLHWGVPVPLEEARNKVLYVWFEAPIGYISATKEWAEQTGQPERWKDYWLDPENTRLIHFIGKDNIVFHAIIFPAMLMGYGGYVLPDNVPANEFLNLEGNKFSTSRGYAVWLKDYLDKFEPDPLRYTLAINMPETRDADFSWREFQARHNNELADILGNFVNRTLRFTHSYFQGKIPEAGPLIEADRQLQQTAGELASRVGAMLDQFRFKEACRLFMDLARAANKYFNDQEPWQTRKTDPARCATTINLCCQTTYWLAILMEPFLPFTSQKVWTMLNVARPFSQASWDEIGQDVLPAGHVLDRPTILFQKIDDTVIEREIDRLHQALTSAPETSTASKEEQTMIDIDTFRKMDLRTARVQEAEAIPGAKKLLKLKVDLGNEQRQLVAGIAPYYRPEELLGKTIVVVANLEPATIRGVESQGMLLAVQDEDRLVLLTTDGPVAPGKRVS